MRPCRITRNLNPVTVFYLNVSMVISLVIVAIYIGIYLRNNSLLMEAVKQQAASYFDLVVRVRRWNASQGGVYVEKKSGIETNAYLRKVGVEPDVTAIDGRVFTLRNPALMTKEISKIFSEYSGVQFHITSMQLLNRDNAPDNFEQKAFKSFGEGYREFSEIERSPAGPRFRYMAPLMVEESCLKCHSNFGYKVGDIRGGISVSIPLKQVEDEMATNRLIIIVLSCLTLVLLLGLIYLILHQMSARIDAANKAIRELSITDELTGLRNRRYLMTRLSEEFERSLRDGGLLGFLMLDLDRFKQINDTHGHQAGDLVLRKVAGALTETLREYDIAGRYGGEEFAVIAVGREISDLLILAERIRKTVELLDIWQGTVSITVTVSIGLAVCGAEDSLESLLKRADEALYQAKNEGRNRSVLR